MSNLSKQPSAAAAAAAAAVVVVKKEVSPPLPPLEKDERMPPRKTNYDDDDDDDDEVMLLDIQTEKKQKRPPPRSELAEFVANHATELEKVYPATVALFMDEEFDPLSMDFLAKCKPKPKPEPGTAAAVAEPILTPEAAARARAEDVFLPFVSDIETHLAKECRDAVARVTDLCKEHKYTATGQAFFRLFVYTDPAAAAVAAAIRKDDQIRETVQAIRLGNKLLTKLREWHAEFVRAFCLRVRSTNCSECRSLRIPLSHGGTFRFEPGTRPMPDNVLSFCEQTLAAQSDTATCLGCMALLSCDSFVKHEAKRADWTRRLAKCQAGSRAFNELTSKIAKYTFNSTEAAQAAECVALALTGAFDAKDDFGALLADRYAHGGASDPPVLQRIAAAVSVSGQQASPLAKIVARHATLTSQTGNAAIEWMKTKAIKNIVGKSRAVPTTGDTNLTVSMILQMMFHSQDAKAALSKALVYMASVCEVHLACLLRWWALASRLPDKSRYDTCALIDEAAKTVDNEVLAKYRTISARVVEVARAAGVKDLRMPLFFREVRSVYEVALFVLPSELATPLGSLHYVCSPRFGKRHLNASSFEFLVRLYVEAIAMNEANANCVYARQNPNLATNADLPLTEWKDPAQELARITCALWQRGWTSFAFKNVPPMLQADLAKWLASEEMRVTAADYAEIAPSGRGRFVQLEAEIKQMESRQQVDNARNALHMALANTHIAEDFVDRCCQSYWQYDLVIQFVFTTRLQIRLHEMLEEVVSLAQRRLYFFGDHARLDPSLTRFVTDAQVEQAANAMYMSDRPASLREMMWVTGAEELDSVGHIRVSDMVRMHNNAIDEWAKVRQTQQFRPPVMATVIIDDDDGEDVDSADDDSDDDGEKKKRPGEDDKQRVKRLEEMRFVKLVSDEERERAKLFSERRTPGGQTVNELATDLLLNTGPHKRSYAADGLPAVSISVSQQTQDHIEAVLGNCMAEDADPDQWQEEKAIVDEIAKTDQNQKLSVKVKKVMKSQIVQKVREKARQKQIDEATKANVAPPQFGLAAVKKQMKRERIEAQQLEDKSDAVMKKVDELKFQLAREEKKAAQEEKQKTAPPKRVRIPKKKPAAAAVAIVKTEPVDNVIRRSDPHIKATTTVAAVDPDLTEDEIDPDETEDEDDYQERKRKREDESSSSSSPPPKRKRLRKRIEDSDE